MDALTYICDILFTNKGRNVEDKTHAHLYLGWVNYERKEILAYKKKVYTWYTDTLSPWTSIIYFFATKHMMYFAISHAYIGTNSTVYALLNLHNTYKYMKKGFLICLNPSVLK